MKLKTVTLTNFRCFRDFSLDLDEQLTVLVARNGAGKTAILDAIAVGLGAFITRLPKVSGKDFHAGDFLVDNDGHNPPYMRVSLESVDEIKWDRTSKRDDTKKTLGAILKAEGLKKLNENVDQYIDEYNQKQAFNLPVFAYYGTSRAVFNIPKRTRNPQKEFPRFDAFHNALEASTHYRRMLDYLIHLDHLELSRGREQGNLSYELPELKTVRKVIESMIPSVSNLTIKVSPPKLLVDWGSGNGKQTLPIEQLSDGYRTTLAMVMDLALRMAQANPDMDDPLQTTGVVLIDEVDLHLHPGWQQTILPDLLRTFPNIQFVVTTHSPQVLTTVPHESIRVIDWENDEPVVKRVGFSEGSQAQQMLNDVLGTNPRPNVPIAQDLKDYFDLVNNNEWESDTAIVLRGKLEEHHGYESELLKADMDIRFRKRRQSHQ